MSLKYRILSAVLVLVMIFGFCSCKAKSNNATVYFELLDKPENLDPQTAFSDSELIIVRNLFEGLMRVNEKGETVEGACESYQKDGKVYTFKLRKGLKWSDGSKVKADDFVFGIERGLDNDTGSPFASRLFAIKNAKAVNSGSKDPSTLGIAADGDRVIISLEYEDSHFLDALASSVAMPCNRDYFEKTEGKYCQNAGSMICNGSYDIFKWNKEEFGIRLYKNDNYSGAFPARNGAVFFSLDSKQTQSERLLNEASDMAFLPVTEIDSIKGEEIKISSVQNICWFLSIGKEYNANMKSALLNAFSSSIFEKEMTSGLSVADSIYPEILNTSGTEGIGMPSYDIERAKSVFSNEIKRTEDEKFPQSVLYYYNKEEIKGIITSIVGHWQQNLCAFVNIKPSESLSSLQEELKDRSLQFAVFPVTAHSSSLSEYLYSLSLSGNAVSAQQKMLSAGDIVPICFESTNIAYNGGLEGVYADSGNGYIDFAYIYKTE